MHVTLHSNHSGYSVIDVLKLLKQMQISAITVPASIKYVFVTLANWFCQAIPTAHSKQLYSAETLGPSMKILEDMSLQSHEVFTEVICLSLLRLMTDIKRSASTEVENSIKSDAVRKFLKLMSQGRVQFNAVETLGNISASLVLE